jgi:carboxypeptidase PM20D1
MGGTDAKYWAPLSDNVYRFMAITMRGNDFTRFHGVDERVGVEDFAGGVQFFAQLIRNSDRLAEAGSQQSDEGGSTIE